MPAACGWRSTGITIRRHHPTPSPITLASLGTWTSCPQTRAWVSTRRGHVCPPTASIAGAAQARDIDLFNCAGGAVDKTTEDAARRLPEPVWFPGRPRGVRPTGRRNIPGAVPGDVSRTLKRASRQQSRMKRFSLAALAAAALSSSTGCCRGWFVWPGHYPHNPSFSQCCDPPWGPDPFRESRREQGWGRGPHAASEAGQDCTYDSWGLSDFFRDDPPPPARGPYGAPVMGPYGPQPAPDAMSAAQVAYPYYTNRGPRDFLMGYPPGTVPPSIGP